MKLFDQALYDADDNAIHQVIKWLNRYGWTLKQNSDLYGIDLVGTDGLNRAAEVEVEVKHHWHGEEFPFDTVHISARKRKFIKPGAFLVMLNHERTHCLALSYLQLSQAKTVTKDTIYTTSEQFLEIPTDQRNVRRIHE